MATFLDHINGLDAEERAELAATYIRGRPLRRDDGFPPILNEGDNPLVLAPCCGKRASADMVVDVDGAYVCDRCRPRP